ncbi:MAG: 3-phosphoshikimate 1-carboxyvinyltransferase [Verrucomicrobiia bacterium]
MKPLPDILEIQPLTKPPNCTITVPGSKSITNRALILSALADGKCILRGALWADDTQVMVDSLQKLGFEVMVEPDPAEECNRTITVVGRGGEIPAKKAELYVGNAGTAARFLTALVCLGHGEYRIDGDARMRERPMKELIDDLRRLGAKIEAAGDHLPATIRCSGLKPGYVGIVSDQTSQFVSALLLIEEKAGLKIYTEPLSLDQHYYIRMTREMVQFFKTHQHEYTIEPDLSSASYFLAAGFVTRGRVQVADWPENSLLQIDKRFRQLLQSLPPEVSRLSDLGDSIMTLAICALFGKSPLIVKDATRLRLQETDRIKAMVTELRHVGAEAEEHEDGFTVWPAEPGQLHGADIETYNDHRMAMCFSVLGLKVPGIRIKNPGCVSKTFPNFFDKLEQLRT